MMSKKTTVLTRTNDIIRISPIAQLSNNNMAFPLINTHANDLAAWSQPFQTLTPLPSSAHVAVLTTPSNGILNSDQWGFLGIRFVCWKHLLMLMVFQNMIQ